MYPEYYSIVAKKIKRTYEVTDEADIAVKIKAAQDHMNPSDVIQHAIEMYCGLKKK